MDMKRPLLTQVPCQTDVGIKRIGLPCTTDQAKMFFELKSIDIKRPLLTQVPSQTDVRIKS
eukprot:scaffold75528_cov32-Attheya_sp.AAC.1